MVVIIILLLYSLGLCKQLGAVNLIKGLQYVWASFWLWESVTLH